MFLFRLNCWRVCWWLLKDSLTYLFIISQQNLLHWYKYLKQLVLLINWNTWLANDLILSLLRDAAIRFLWRYHYWLYHEHLGNQHQKQQFLHIHIISVLKLNETLVQYNWNATGELATMLTWGSKRLHLLPLLYSHWIHEKTTYKCGIVYDCGP